MEKNELVERIRKLLSLAESDNENEATQAMAKAQELMAKHNIELKEVENKMSEVIEKATGEYTMKKWVFTLASVIAENFRCECFFRGWRTRKTVFIGFEEDVEIASLLYNATVNFIEKSSNKQYRKFKKLGMNTQGVKQSYAMGFIKGLNRKFEEQKSQNQEWGLVLKTPKDVKESFNKKKFDGEINLGVTISNIDAMVNGIEDGRNFELHEKIESEEK